MKNILIFCVNCLLIFIMGACSQPKPSADTRDISKLRISLQRTNCYGKCPVYKVTLHGSGTIEFDGYANTKMLGKHSAQIPVDSMRALLTDIETKGYFGLKDSYEEYQMTDLPTVFTEVEIDGVLKKIKHYQGDLTTPQALSDLETHIDEIAIIRRWLE